MANTPDYTIDYTDERFGKVDGDRDQAMTDLDNVYNGMIGQTDKYFTDQIDSIKDWGDTQAQIQQQQTDFTIEQINQQKDQAKKDYIKEQSGAYVDWQKQSNQYGANAEKMASAGLTNTGYSESSQVSMYNTYQNRVATAREVFNQAVLNYNNSIKEAQLQNSAALAEIAFQTLQQTLELSLQGFQYKNQLILEQANKKIELDNIYYNRYQDVLQQINTENALAEDIRQYNETMKWNTTQAELNRQHDIKLKEIQHNYDVKMAEIDQKYKLAYLNASTEKEKELLKIQHQNDIAKLNKQLENEKALLAYQKSLNSSKITGGGSGGSGGGSGGSSGSGGVKISGSNNKVTTSNTTNAKVNTQSKLSLGKGPISDSKAAQMVNAGQATARLVNGQVVLSPAVSLPTSKLRR
jgi:uncharacterized membrane protein YgcG